MFRQKRRQGINTKFKAVPLTISTPLLRDQNAMTLAREVDLEMQELKITPYTLSGKSFSASMSD